MIDKLLDYYQRELSFLREMGSEFARKYPKVAGRLRIDADAIEDPHVSRFIEASALLAARTRLKIDDEFPEICQSILQALYPHYLAPFPPTSVVQAKLNDVATENVDGYQLARGSRLESESIDGEPCRFRTCFDTKLWPMDISQVDYLVPPLPFATSPWNRDLQSAIRIRFKSASAKIKLSQLNLDHLRLFLGGSTACANALVDALFSQLLGLALIDSSNLSAGHDGRNASTIWLSQECVEAVGYKDEQGILPQDSRSLSAYRILSEFFAASDKFRFIDVQLENVWQASSSADGLDLVFFLKRSYPVLQRELDNDALRIGCTPIVNLFFKRAEPIRLTNNVAEYRVIPSSRGTANNEIFSIDRVTALSSGGEEREFLPFFSPNHASDNGLPERYWSAKRVRSMGLTSDDDRGTDVYLSIVDLHGQSGGQEGWTLDVETTCLNRDRVARLPYSLGQPRLRFVEGGTSVNVQCVTPPTATLRSIDREDLHWRLISHLTLNHLILLNSEQGAESLREILRLYNPEDSAEARQVVESVVSVHYRRSVARVPGGPATGFCRGVEVEVLLDEERLGGIGTVLFAKVLEHFFGLFATLNSYTRTSVRTLASGQPVLVGKVRAGDQTLL